MKDIQHMASFHTGDINLAAALMACGIPLSPTNAVTLIESTRTDSLYASFKLCGASSDGKDSTETLMAVWSGNKEIPDTHPFSVISAFISAKPREIRDTDSIFAFALDYLAEQGFNPQIPNLRDVPDLCQRFPQAIESYILAFVWNRDVCFKLYRDARREVHQTNGTGSDIHQTLIDHRLPRWQRNELLSRLQG